MNVNKGKTAGMMLPVIVTSVLWGASGRAMAQGLPTHGGSAAVRTAVGEAQASDPGLDGGSRQPAIRKTWSKASKGDRPEMQSLTMLGTGVFALAGLLRRRCRA